MKELNKYQKVSKKKLVGQRNQTQHQKRRFRIQTFNFMDKYNGKNDWKEIEKSQKNEIKEKSPKSSYSITKNIKKFEIQKWASKFSTNFRTLKTSNSQRKKLKVKNKPMFTHSSSAHDIINSIDIEKFLFHITSKRKEILKQNNPLSFTNMKNYSEIHTERLKKLK